MAHEPDRSEPDWRVGNGGWPCAGRRGWPANPSGAAELPVHGAFIGDRYKTCRPVTRSASKERETARMIYERNPERLEADDAD